jgi:hypothetical protein
MRTFTSRKKTVVCGFLLLVSLPLEVLAQNTGFVRRYAANFTAFGFEISTAIPPAPNAEGGLIIYNKNFFVADDINTLYVTISATGDDHNGARLQLACKVDGKPCQPGAGDPAGGAPSGWHTGLRFKNYNNNLLPLPFAGDGGGGAGDVHDNHVMYTWCTPFETKAGTHNVQVRLASSPGPGDPGGGLVFLEAIHFFIDGARVASADDRCTNNVVDANVATEPSTTTAPDGTLIDTTLFVPLAEPSTLTVPPTIQTELP